MPEFRTMHAKDNPDHEKKEAQRQAQRDRDRAETDRRNAKAGAAASENNNQAAIEAEAKLGAGPAGLNKGPSDTISSDPHNPNRVTPASPTGGMPRQMETPGMGFSPPDGPAPGSDRPRHEMPAVERAKLSGTDEARQAGEQAKREHAAEQEKEADAQARLDEASRRIGENQAPGPADRKNEQGRD